MRDKTGTAPIRIVRAEIKRLTSIGTTNVAVGTRGSRKTVGMEREKIHEMGGRQREEAPAVPGRLCP